jgi:hypothetical protein
LTIKNRNQVTKHTIKSKYVRTEYASTT